MPVLKSLARFGLDGFLLCLVGAVSLSFVVPDLGRTDGLIHLDLFTQYGISVVFLLYGLGLSAERLRAGLLNWRLHLLTQAGTFLLFPLLVWGLMSLGGSLLSPALKLGFFYLAASSSTISSSVAMTSLARGNVAGAIFNASLSSLIGVVATPLWMELYLSQTGQSLDISHVIVKILAMVVAPVILGQLLRPLVWPFLSTRARLVKLLDRGTILAIVFNSFSDSVEEKIWSGHGPSLLILVAGLCLGLFFSVLWIMRQACHVAGLNEPDTVAGVFCGTKKSVATGVPMAKLMFGNSPLLGMVIAPIMVYHFLQLVCASVIARRWASKIEAMSGENEEKAA